MPYISREILNKMWLGKTTRIVNQGFTDAHVIECNMVNEMVPKSGEGAGCFWSLMSGFPVHLRKTLALHA